MIRLDGIAKSRGGRPVLASVDLRVKRGQVLCLAGPSGSGKSTLLDIAAGIIRPDRGRRWLGEGRLGYALQDDSFLPWLTAHENLLFVLAGTGLPGAENRARFWMDRLGLAESAMIRPGRLSGGQRRRLNLARSLVVEPGLLLWDEPFAFLDDLWQGEVSRILDEVHRNSGPAVVVVTHREERSLLPGWPVLEITRCPVELEWGC